MFTTSFNKTKMGKLTQSPDDPLPSHIIKRFTTPFVQCWQKLSTYNISHDPLFFFTFCQQYKCCYICIVSSIYKKN